MPACAGSVGSRAERCACARCLGADDRGRAGSGRAGDLHDPVSRSDGADVVMLLPTDLSAETSVPPLTNAVEGTAEAGFPDDIAPRPEDYVFLKRRPSAFYGTGVAELLHMLRRDTIIIGGGATNRGVETSVREAFNFDICGSARMLLEQRSRRSRLQPRQGDENVRAHPKPRPGRGDVAGVRAGVRNKPR